MDSTDPNHPNDPNPPLLPLVTPHSRHHPGVKSHEAWHFCDFAIRDFVTSIVHHSPIPAEVFGQKGRPPDGDMP